MNITVFEWESVCGTDLSPEGLRAFGNVSFYGTPKKEDVVSLVGDAEAVLCSKVVFSREVLEACPKLRYIGLMATGYNNVDVKAAREMGVTVTNVPDYSADAVCQMTLSFLLQFSTSLIQYNASTKNGDWTRSSLFCYYPFPMQELAGKTLGLAGMGSIGTKVARAAEALGMRVIYFARGKKDLPYEFVSKERLFSESDFLSLHLPLTEETADFICEESLSLMKKSAYLINTARGGLVKERDLAKALREGHIAGFAADVLAAEPQREDCPLIGCPNCILTPHVAWAPPETRKRLWGILEENLRSFLKGAPQNQVN